MATARSTSTRSRKDPRRKSSSKARRKPVARPSARAESVSMKAMQSKVFPVVLRIKQEIDFCFSSFYGDLAYDARVCERQFAKWVSRGHRGPGELSIYIDMLATHLEVPTQQSIFRHLANDCILVIKRSKPQSTSGGVFSRYRGPILLNLGIVVLMGLVFYIGMLVGS